LRDLGSANGTFVNDQRLSGEIWLKPGDAIRVGPYRFVLGADQFTAFDESGGLRLEAIGLNKWVQKDLNLLKNISLVFQPRDFVVIVGQSGGGKSTLVDALAGFRPSTDGQVVVNDVDIYKHFDVIRNDIGFVPQKDIIHMELTVFQALDYAAQLRMPADTTPEERHKRVMEVLEDLDLVHRKDVQISGLSGGQQKRVSIGVELLTRPGLFFLDEPTSGLDPGTETALMHLMRRLADQGRTIILITHATKNVMLADKVVFLARGGYLAWFGPPDEALQYFDQFRSERDRRSQSMEFDAIYAILDDPSQGSAQEWAERYSQHPAYQKYIAAPLNELGHAVPGAAASVSPARTAVKATKSTARVSGMRQFSIFSGRNIKILTRDRASLILMLAAAPVVALLDVVLAVVLGRDLFAYQDGSMANTITSFFMPLLYAMIVGALSQMREFVKEKDIYKRERLVNLKVFPYVLSKVWVAALLALYQAAAFAIIHYLAFKMPGGVQEFGLFYFTLFMAVFSGMMLGLFASAVAPNANAAPLLVILLIVPQLVLAGAMIPVPGKLSGITSTRWAFESLVSISGAGSDVAADACWALPEDERYKLTLDEKASLKCGCMGVNALNQASCKFPGIGQYYDPALDQAEPLEPASIGDPPAEPALPTAPQRPLDQTNQVAMGKFLQDMQDYQTQVDQIRADFKVQ
jgi:ABC-type multidrug transport system ATPase subunit